MAQWQACLRSAKILLSSAACVLCVECLDIAHHLACTEVNLVVLDCDDWQQRVPLSLTTAAVCSK